MSSNTNPIRSDSFFTYENASYIPVLSTAKAVITLSYSSLVLTAVTIVNVVVHPLTLVAKLFIGFEKETENGYSKRVFCFIDPERNPELYDFLIKYQVTTLYHVDIAMEAASEIARGILETIPVIGNLALAYWDGKITQWWNSRNQLQEKANLEEFGTFNFQVDAKEPVFIPSDPYVL